MHSPAFAIAWQLWTRHRWGIVTALATLGAMIAASPLLPLVVRMIASSIVLVLVIGYFMHILLFTESFGSMDSTYPRRMYALPVSSRTLVGWPMLYGGAVVALLWTTGACLIYRPSGFQMPVLLPSLWLTALMVWFQAFAWSPIRNCLLKFCLLPFFIPLLLAVPMRWIRLWVLAVNEGQIRQGVRVDSSLLGSLLTWIPEPVVWTLLVTYIAMAYLVARAGLGSDRKGDTWQVLPRGMLQRLLTPRRERLHAPFRSPAEAQLWYEWDCHGLIFPVGGAGLLLLMTAPTIHGRGDPGEMQLVLITFAIVSTCMAVSMSLAVGSLRPRWVRSREFITFLATRPMSSGAMAAAKLRMAALSLLLMFSIMAVEIALWVVAAGYTAEAGELGRRFLVSFPGWKAAAALVLGAVTLPALTWGLATAGFPVFLADRNSLHVGCNLALLAGGMAFGSAVIGLINHPVYLGQLIAALPWLVAAATVVKLIVASLAFRACRRLGLMTTRSMIVLIAAALALAACSIALAALLSDARVLPLPMSVVLLGIVMLVPLGRLALAPLALEWNRHR